MPLVQTYVTPCVIQRRFSSEFNDAVVLPARVDRDVVARFPLRRTHRFDQRL
jgi:hypothetical protein